MSSRRPGDRLFGFVFAGGLCLVAGAIWFWTRRIVWGLPIAAAVVLLIALILPRLLLPLNLLWSGLVAPLVARINNRLILGLIFFAVLTPIALLRRLFGSDPLRLRREASRDSYFEPVAHQTSKETLNEVF